jgi:ATP-dependent DNA ligase
MKRFDALLSSLPSGCIFDGEIVVLDEFDRLRFNALSSAGARRQYVAFDVLYANAQDARAMPLSSRKSVLKQLLAVSTL